MPFNGVYMLNKSVAVVDVRSSDMTAVVAERGVNNTFVIKSKFSCGYDGYAEGRLLDARSFSDALRSVVKSTVAACGSRIKSLCITVPGEFTEVAVTDNAISFQSSRKVSATDIRALDEASVPQPRKGWRVVRSGCLYYVLSDMRRVVDPEGMLTDSLRGRLCHYMCASPFCGACESVLESFGITDIKFIPSVHAEAMYLIAPEQRDEFAVLFDFGFISSSYSVICGNGVVYSESFSLGSGHIALYLMETMDIPYDVALALLGKVNLNSRENEYAAIEHTADGKIYSFPLSELKARIREALDGICEAIEECANGFTERNTNYKTLYVTGESATCVRGAVDYMSERLARKVSIVSPHIPFYDKPQFGPLFSLLDTALSDREKSSLLLRFFR